MKVEFIIDKKEYQKLLSKDKFDKKIIYTNEHVKGKNNYLLTLSVAGRSFAAAKILSDNRILVEKLFEENGIKYRLLTEEASQFFVKRLYPYACEFETKLRKFIYIALFDLDEGVERTIEKKFDRGTKQSEKADKILPKKIFLEQYGLGLIFDVLFGNEDFLSNVKNITADKASHNCRLTKKALINEITKLEEKTIWNQLFAPNCSDSFLPDIYGDIQHYRNDIMHFHYISSDEYKTAQGFYTKGIKDLNKQLNKGIVIESTKTNIDVLSDSWGVLSQYLINAQNLSKSLVTPMTSLSAKYISSMQKIATALISHTDEYARMQAIASALATSVETLAKLSDIYPLQENT